VAGGACDRFRCENWVLLHLDELLLPNVLVKLMLDATSLNSCRGIQEIDELELSQASDFPLRSGRKQKAEAQSSANRA